MDGSSKTVLVVDDDQKIRLLLSRCLEADGYRVLEAANSSEVHQTLQADHIDLITLDLQLGPDNGLDIAADIRKSSTVPIIMVTGKGEVIDKVVGLEVGADDYISKPFHVREVQARVRSLLRRSEFRSQEQGELSAVALADDRPVYSFNGWKAYPDLFELRSPDGQICDLTSTDFRLLMLFLGAPKRVLSRDKIMGDLNGAGWTAYDRTVDNQVARLRKKIEVNPSSPRIIKTVRGVGYTFAADVCKSNPVSSEGDAGSRPTH